MSELDLRGYDYLPNGVHNQVLLSLLTGSKTANELWESVKHPIKGTLILPEFIAQCLDALESESLIDRSFRDYAITYEGRVMLNFLAGRSLQPETLTVAARVAYTPKKEYYQGHELQTTSPRRGAYDFLAKPSRINDEYTPHPTAYLAAEHREQFGAP